MNEWISKQKDEKFKTIYAQLSSKLNSGKNLDATDKANLLKLQQTYLASDSKN